MVPKVIFTIWAGGDKMMPEKNIALFKKWLKLNPKFHGVIYIDKLSTPKETLVEFECTINAEGSNIELRDITEANVSDIFVRYEIDRLTPNYGKSSDLIRYNALYRDGGFYIDSDVQPGVLPEALFNQSEPIFCVDDCAQGCNGIANDAILCSAKHPIMKRVIDLAHSNYCKLHGSWEDRFREENNDFGPTANPYTLDFENGNPFEEWVYRTIMITGSGALLPALQENGILPQRKDKGYKHFKFNEIKYSHNIDFQYSLSKRGILKKIEGHDESWGKCKIRNLNNKNKEDILEEAISRSIDSINFEAKMMGLLRLDYHIHMIMCALGEPTYDVQYSKNESPSANETKIAAMLIERLASANLNYAEINNVAWVSRHHLVRMFYQDKLQGFFSDEQANLDRHILTLISIVNNLADESQKKELINYALSQLLKNEKYLAIRMDSALKNINFNYISISKREEKKLPPLAFQEDYYNDGSKELIILCYQLLNHEDNFLNRKLILYFLLMTEGKQSYKVHLLNSMNFPSHDIATDWLRASIGRELDIKDTESLNIEIEDRMQKMCKCSLPASSHFNSSLAFFKLGQHKKNLDDDKNENNYEDKKGKPPSQPRKTI